MRLLHNKITEIVILIPIVAVFVFAGYFLANTYKNYNSTNSMLKDQEYITLLQELVEQYDNQKSAVALYLGSNGQIGFGQLKKQWDNTDQNIIRLKQYVNTHPSYLKRSQPLFELLSAQKENRSKISVLNTDYGSLYPQKESIGLLLTQQVHSLASDHSEKEYRNIYQTLAQLSSYKDAVYSERGITTYFLVRGAPIVENELALWDPLIGRVIEPDYKELAQKEIVQKLDPLFEDKAYKALAPKIKAGRIAIIAGSAKGDFSIDLKAWYALLNQKISSISKAENILNHYISKQLNQKNDHNIKTMSLAAVVLAITLVLAWIVHNTFKKMEEETKQLEEVLQTIEQDGSEEMEQHLKEMLQKQNKQEIYQFLAYTIRESKESKRLADEANATKSKFLANMSHEIRTPLNGIVGFTGLLKASNLDTEQQEFIEIIEKSSENLLAVINDILDLSKIENNKIEIEAIAFDPIEELESGIEAYGAKAAEKDIDLGFYIDPTLTENLVGDPTRIKQVVVNLISNAVKFTPEGGEINVIAEKVSSEENKTTIKFSVQDSGIGITQEQKEKIFEAFSQADASTNRKFGGTGLGLTISKTLVELMGGKLDLESEEGKGTTFYFTLAFDTLASLDPWERYDVLNVGYLMPEEGLHTSDHYMVSYLDAINTSNHRYTDPETLLKLQPDQQPDLLFVNYAHVSDEMLEQLCKTDTKVVLLTTLKNKDHLDIKNFDLFKTIYAPINFSKLKKTIKLLSQDAKIAYNRETETRFENIHALVAEDNVINQKLIKRTLESIGIKVTLAENGKEALEKRQEDDSIDVVFMDIQMPVMNGIEATQAILSYEKEAGKSHIPIIALTANALKGDREYFLSQGLDQYVSKPMQLKVIVNTLLLYFMDKVVHESDENVSVATEDKPETPVESPVPEVKESSFDVLLYKRVPSEAKMFSAILHKIGYSVEVVNDLATLESKLQENHYKYVLLDRERNYLENSKIPELLREHSIQSILFVDDIHAVHPQERVDYTYVTLNVADLQLIRFIMAKIALVKSL